MMSDTDSVTVSTFNLLCPAYKRLPGEPDAVRESQSPDDYIARNKKILRQPVWNSSIVCCQEFWYDSPHVRRPAANQPVKRTQRSAAS